MSVTMGNDLVNADVSQRVLLDTDELPWHASPQIGVERRLLDRVGGEVARATSIVRYANGQDFPAHLHARGEEFLVLDGIFSDEHGDYPTGTYVRNPPGSRHAPRTGPGCMIFVKLRQMQPSETARLIVDTTRLEFRSTAAGLETGLLFKNAEEIVAIERLVAGACRVLDAPGGCEVLLLSGALRADGISLGSAGWLRVPPETTCRLEATATALYWIKTGHLIHMQD